jgi:hypothetical protein
MGIGGEHAAILAAFLDLPEPHKWPRQNSVLERHLFQFAESIKEQSQLQATNSEVAKTLDDEEHIVEQTLLQLDLPIRRVEASCDMGWPVRSSGGKYGSSMGYALLIRAQTQKVLDSVVFNKKCRVCTKHEQRTGTNASVREHVCIKKFVGSSKSMEATALVKMLI